MLRVITMPMMILICSCGTIVALKRIRTGKFTNRNSVIHSMYCFLMFRMKFGIMFSAAIIVSPAFLTFPITKISFATRYSTFFCRFKTKISPLMNSFAFFCFTIFFTFFQKTDFAIVSVSIGAIRTFVKFRKRFDFFANSAAFGYDLLSHNRFLSTILVRAGYQPHAGYRLVYYTPF